MSEPRFQLTRRAALDLRDIYEYSSAQWGEKQALVYIDKLYAAMARLPSRASAAKARAERARPFIILPVEKHFIVYDQMGGMPVIITVLHQRRDLETIIRDLTQEFLAEVSMLRK
jgi:toxin ParE1/3/4